MNVQLHRMFVEIIPAVPTLREDISALARKGSPRVCRLPIVKTLMSVQPSQGLVEPRLSVPTQRAVTNVLASRDMKKGLWVGVRMLMSVVVENMSVGSMLTV